MRKEIEEEQKQPVKVYGYTRVSTKEQVGGYSLKAQETAIEKYASAYGMDLVRVYSDEGRSGKDVEHRPAFTEMLSDIATEKDCIQFVIVFKLSRFGRSAKDALESLEKMKEHDVDLICIEDSINTSKGLGKTIFTILCAIAEMERENISVQTMAGREQKARDGRWNGGFAPYGYKLNDGALVIAEDEADVIRTIFDKYVHTAMGTTKIADYLNTHYQKKIRQNGSLEYFSQTFVSKVIDNPVYKGCIAYGRRRTEKYLEKEVDGRKIYGYKPVPQDEYLLAEGEHQGIVSEELWNKAQARKSTVSARPPKKHSLDHEHLLSGLLKCPVCGGGMYGNVNRKKKKDGSGEYYKDCFYYGCKHRMAVDGHNCDYRRQWNQEVINGAVEELIYKVVDNERFKAAMVEKIGQQVNVSDLEKEIGALEQKLEKAKASKNFILRELDNLGGSGLYCEQKQKDFEERLNAKYAEIEALTDAISKVRVKISNVESNNIRAQQVYSFLVDFRKYYSKFKDIDKKLFLQSIISDVYIYPEKQADGRIVKGIKFRFPIYYDGRDTDIVGWDTESSVETVVLLSKLHSE